MIQRLTIIGVGLLGGSVALAAKKEINNLRITGYDQVNEAGREGYGEWRASPAIDRWEPLIAPAVDGAELVVIATPIAEISATIIRLRDQLPATAIVTDVGSAKQGIVAVGEKCLGSRFVGSHPMAGGSRSGAAAARADLFQDAACVVTPTAATDAAALQLVKEFWTVLGARVIEQTPAEHDRLVAFASHLPHALAAALMAVQEEGSLAIRGKGLTDTSRVAAGDAGLWRDIFAANRENVLASIDAFGAQLSTFRDLLAIGDDAAVHQWLQTQAERRRAID